MRFCQEEEGAEQVAGVDGASPWVRGFHVPPYIFSFYLPATQDSSPCCRMPWLPSRVALTPSCVPRDSSASIKTHSIGAVWFAGQQWCRAANSFTHPLPHLATLPPCSLPGRPFTAFRFPCRFITTTQHAHSNTGSSSEEENEEEEEEGSGNGSVRDRNSDSNGDSTSGNEVDNNGSSRTKALAGAAAARARNGSASTIGSATAWGSAAAAAAASEEANQEGPVAPGVGGLSLHERQQQQVAARRVASRLTEQQRKAARHAAMVSMSRNSTKSKNKGQRPGADGDLGGGW